MLFWQTWIGELILTWFWLPEIVWHTGPQNSSRKDDMSWFQNTSNQMVWVFLWNREFIVSVSDIFSEARMLNRGVPQRSILGLLLFLMYIDDHPQSLSDSYSYLF